MRRAPILLALVLLALSSIVSAQAVRELDLGARHVVWDPVSQRLYASVRTPDAHSDSVAVIEPVSGAIERYIPVGSTPNRMAVSGDGQYLYVALDGDQAIARIKLQDLTLDGRFDLGVGFGTLSQQVVDLAVAPGRPSTVAVVLGNELRGDSIAVFDDGVKRPTVARLGAQRVAFGRDASSLYAIDPDWRDSSFLHRLTLNAQGIQTFDGPYEIPGAGDPLFANGLLYVGSAVLDAASLTVVGRFPRSVTLDLANGSGSAMIAPDRLEGFDLSTFARRWSATVPLGDLGQTLFLVPAGRDRLAQQTEVALRLIDLSSMRKLTVLKVGGRNGLVTSSPESIDCGDSCASLFPAGTQVTLRAAPGFDGRFMGWEGDADCLDGVVTMDEPHECRAVFSPLTTGEGTSLSLPANDVAYSPYTAHLYASVPGRDVTHGNTITEIDPVTGTFGRAATIVGEPGRMALSGDGRALFVIVNGGYGIRRLDLDTMIAGPVFGLGIDTSVTPARPARAQKLVALPNNSTAVVVLQSNGIVLYRNGTPARLSVTPLPVPLEIGFGASGTTLYGFGTANDGNTSTLMRFGLTADGISALDTRQVTWIGPAVFLSGRLYASRGSVLDPETGQVVASYASGSSGGLPVPDGSGDMSYVGSGSVSRSPQATHWLIQSCIIPGTSGAAGDSPGNGDANWNTDWSAPRSSTTAAVSVGSGRLAFSTDDDQLFLFHWDEERVYTIGIFSPGRSITVTADVADVDGKTGGTTPFQLRYRRGTKITLTGQSPVGDQVLSMWQDPWGSGYAATLTHDMLLTSSVSAYYAYPASTIESVTPSTGPATGGTTVTIKGTNFFSPMDVTFDGVHATSVTVLDRQTLVVVTPPHNPGSAWVGTINVNGMTGYLPSGYTFAAVSNPAILDSLTPSPVPPVATGTAVTWTVVAHGGTGPLQYEFAVQPQSTGSWSVFRDWAASGQASWCPLAPGAYVIRARVRSSGVIVAESTISTVPFSVTRVTARAVLGAITTSVHAPVAPGTAVTIATSASGGVEPLEFKFWLYSQATGFWSVLQDWSAATQAQWTPTVAGSYAIEAWVRSHGSVDTCDDWGFVPTFVVTSPGTIVGPHDVTLAVNRQFPVQAGAAVTMTAAAAATGSLEYQFWLYDSNTALWSMLRDYASSPSATWNPTTAGTYAAEVWIRSQGSSARYEAWQGLQDLVVTSGGTGASLPVVRNLDVVARHVIWSPVTQRLYASVQSPETHNDSVAVIEPLAGVIERYIRVGSTPNRLAISDDGQYLYVGIAGAIRRVSLGPIPSERSITFGGSTGPADIAVAPGAPRTIAVAGEGGGVEMFDDDVRRSRSASAGTRIAFSTDGTRLYAASGGSGLLRRLNVTEAGVTPSEYGVGEFPFGQELRYSEGLLHTGPMVLDPESLRVQATYPMDVVTDPDGAEAFGQSGGIVIFDARTQVQLAVWNSSATNTGPFVAWGHRRLAQQTTTGLELLDLSPLRELTLSVANAIGTVSTSPWSVACTGTCSALFADGSEVALTAKPAPNTRFVRWEGDADCADGLITLTESRSCRAVFEQLTTGRGTQIPLQGKGIAFSALTGKLYVTVSGGNRVLGNSIVEIDPVTGEFGRSLWAGSDPGKLSMGSDGQTLWVSLHGGRTLRRIDVSSMTAGEGFRLQPDTLGDPWSCSPLLDFEAVPGEPDAVAVVDSPWADRVVTVYRNGLGTAVPNYGTLHRQSDGRAYLTDGRVVDAATGALVARLSLEGSFMPTAVAPDVERGDVYYVTVPGEIRTTRIDTATFASLESVTHPVYSAACGNSSLSDAWGGCDQHWTGPLDAVAAGDRRLAFVTDRDSLVLFHFGDPVTHLLSVRSSGLAGSVSIGIDVADISGLSSGAPPLLRRYPDGTTLHLDAPPAVGDALLYGWRGGNSSRSPNPRAWTLTWSTEFTAVYKYPVPTVASISPSVVLATGGTSITITGTNFHTPMGVDIGYVQATNVQVLDSTTIVATTPVGQVGVATVRLTSSDQQYAYSSLTYVAPATLAALVPVPSAPFKVGVAVTWTAQARNGVGPLQYQFWGMDSTFTWSVLQDWSTSSQVTLTPARKGSYAVEARVRSNGSSVAYEARLSSGSFGAVEEAQGGDAGDIPVPGDYDGDHITDVAVFRPSTGYWYIMRSSFPTSRAGKLSIRWGLPTDVPVPGDYDGDGKADIGVWRPSTGHWYVLLSSRGYSMNSYLDVQWGYPTDRPMPGDYDGDGRTDIGVWRPSTGHWYVLLSSESYWPGSYLDVLWGYATDQPLLGDFDGDGRADIGVWRPSTGYWYVLWSSQQYRASTYLASQWGFSTDVPQVGDFDGDGKADITVWRPSTGYWYARLSGQGYATSSYLARQWGLPTDLPVPGDYDGDGKTDLGVHRRSDATSYVLDSSHAYGYDFYRWIVCGSWLTGA